VCGYIVMATAARFLPPPKKEERQTIGASSCTFRHTSGYGL
jgi:hypothetical protein